VKQLVGKSEQEAQEELTKLRQVEDMSEHEWGQLWQKILTWRAKVIKPDLQETLTTSESDALEAQAQAEKERKFQEAKRALGPWLHDAMNHIAPAKKQNAEQLWQGLQIGFDETRFKDEINALKKVGEADGNLNNTIEKLQDGLANERSKRLREHSDESLAIKMRTLVLLPITLFWLSTQ